MLSKMTPSNQTWEEVFRDGKYFKTFREYYGNNQLCYETTYINRKKDGYMKKWHRNGSMKKYVEYSDGKMNGIFQRWYPNNQLLMEGTCSSGTRIGVWKYFNNDGTLKEEKAYSS